MSFVAPDWRNEAEYPAPDKRQDMSFWAWQFLRRNKAYQKEWAGYVASLRVMADRDPELSEFVEIVCSAKYSLEQRVEKLKLVRNPDLRNREYWHASDWPESESIAVYMQRTRATLEVKEVALARQWGLTKLLNPAISEMGRLSSLAIARGPLFLAAENPYHENTNFAVVAIDMRYPVETLRAQFEFLLRYREQEINASRVTPYKARPHRSLPYFGKYLRVLDAIDGGEKISEIAKILLPKQDEDGASKAVRNWKNAAEKIRDGDYKLLPAFVRKNKKKK